MYPFMRFASEGWPAAAIQSLEGLAREHSDLLRVSVRDGVFPAAVYRRLGELGLIGLLVPEAHGGSGVGIAEYCLVSEEVGRLGLVSPQTAVQGQQWLLEWGSSWQRQAYLPGLATGSVVFAEAISEPGVGSSFAAMRARAQRAGDGWVISGAKTHVNLGAEADLMIVYAKTDEGLTAFLVEKETPGLLVTRSDPIGLRLLPTADVVLDGVRVGPGAVLGKPGQGLETFLTTFNVSRLGNASELIGLARRGLAMAIDYARARQVGDHVVTDFQGIQWAIADCHQALLAAAALRDHAVARIASGADPALHTTIAKNAAIDAAQKVIKDCFSLVGGHGLYRDQPYLDLVGDIYVLRTAGGSREVLRNYAARRILKSPTYEGLK